MFAETVEARTHNYTAGHFSFNVEAGRCTRLRGRRLHRDRHAVPGRRVHEVPGQCRGKRYRHEILDVKYRGRNIADVLEMTVREAFTFFRGQTEGAGPAEAADRRGARLPAARPAGQHALRRRGPAAEAGRLHERRHAAAARCSSSTSRPPACTFNDVVQLLDCFEALLDVGHSLIVVEHNLQLMKAADYIIDLGPGAAEEGGQVVATGTPEKVSRELQSVTGRFLAEVLKREVSGKTA